MTLLSTLQLGTKRPLRVAAYVRVSTSLEIQDGSFEAQIAYFEREIKNHPGWELAGIYGDRLTGTDAHKRTDFRRMIDAAKAGKIDYIVTKSISRFSRNVHDTMKTVHELTALDVGVYFLEEGMDTLSMDQELILTALATIAEMESESISENIRVSLDAANARGTPVGKCAYGYGRDGNAWIPDSKQAVRVKLAYLMAAHGYGFTEIAARLNQFEEVDQSGREWTMSTVKHMLKSEVYIGDILTNKTVIVRDETGKRQVANEGRIQQYYIEGHHVPMVGKKVWAKINEMMEKQELGGQTYFHGVDEVRTLADADRLLADVRKLLPQKQSRWMKLHETRVREYGPKYYEKLKR